jgi:hypothetical protein
MSKTTLRFYCSPVGVECRWMAPAYKDRTRPEWVDMTDVSMDELAAFVMDRLGDTTTAAQAAGEER